MEENNQLHQNIKFLIYENSSKESILSQQNAQFQNRITILS